MPIFVIFPHLVAKKCLLKKLFPTLLTSFFGVCYTAFRGVLKPVKYRPLRRVIMKKILAFLLCLFTIISLFSCDNQGISSDNGETTVNDTSSEGSRDYGDILRLYRLALNSCANIELTVDALSITAEALGITDPQEKETFADIMVCIRYNYDGEKKADSTSPIYWLALGYAIKDINGDGVDELVLLKEDYTVLAIFTYADGKPIMVGGYYYYKFTTTRPYLTNCWIYGDGTIYTSDLSGFDRFRVYRIAEDGKSLETVADYGWSLYMDYTINSSITKYYKCIDGQKIEISEDEYQAIHEQYEKRLGSYSVTEANKEYAGFDYVSLFSEAELIEEIYASALNNETMVCYNHEYRFLKTCHTPYDNIRLSDVANIKYGFADLDGDGIGEPVIACGDTIILRYYDRTVYAYAFSFREMHHVTTNGTYSWNHNGSRFEYGSEKIYFEGADLRTKELYRIVDDGEPNAEYYIEGKQVSQEELQKYFEYNPVTYIEYSPVDESWYYRLSLEEAYERAVKYWRLRPDEPDGACGTLYYSDAFVMATPGEDDAYGDDKYEDDVYYHFLCINKGYYHDGNGNVSLIPRNIIIYSELLIDTTTGECIELKNDNHDYYYDCGYTINPHEAIDIASEYWGMCCQFQTEIIEGAHIFSKVVISEFPHCTDKYYRVVLKREYYTNAEEGIFTDNEPYPVDTPNSNEPYKVEMLKEILIDAVTGECIEIGVEDNG